MTPINANAKNIVILTGAGISAESGIQTFRAADGLWEDHRIEAVATPQGFAADPALVHRFYNARRRALKDAKPNPAHCALAKLETAMQSRGDAFMVVTQNVDDLHERGGSRAMLHMHGALKRSKCVACDWSGAQNDDTSIETRCTGCGTRATIRPDIVWFGEMPYFMEKIERALQSCDLFVSIGTSGAVYPAAGFVQTAKAYGAKALELNLEPSAGSHHFDETRLGLAGNLVPAWVDEVLT